MRLRETPVFFDQSGKRWLMVENLIILVIAILGVLSYWLIPQMLELRRPPSLAMGTFPNGVSQKTIAAQPTPSVNHLMKSLASKNTAVIGAGPLVRLIQVDGLTDGTYAVDPFTHKVLQKLTDQDIEYINGDGYAIQLYGAAKEKRIALTFDDGPDAIYTPKLLDVLARESVPSTFFVIGNNAVKYPEIMKRLASEGHLVGNHTFSHIDFDYSGTMRDEQEINQNQRVILATTGKDTAFFRPPYEGNTDQAYRNNLKAILTAQKSGYAIATFDFDTDDWRFASGKKPTYPTFDGNNMVVLLHDGGGDRSRTITYVQNLIKLARGKGYTFATLKDLYPAQTATAGPAHVELADATSLNIARAVLVWPRKLVNVLFIFSLTTLVAISLLNILLAISRKATVKYPERSKKYSPHTTIILPAYNEETVIEKSVASLLRSDYKKIQIIIVDDGSTDDTWQVARSLAKRYKRVTVLHQENSGKAAALNNAIDRSESDIVICLDADTLFPPQTISKFIRHFEDETVGAVAGVVKVGNPNNLLTKWQALEYISGISIERNAQALLGAITIIPGACGAWRRSALIEAGGFSTSTLAEDCDLALKIQEIRRYKILQDNEAVSYTEAPQSLTALRKQRFRWTFGNIQSLWKHRRMILNKRYGWLGMYVMPSSVIAILVPILFWPLLMSITLENILSGNYQVIVLFFLLSLVVQFVTSVIGLILAEERFSYLVAVPFAPFIYGPIRIYILYKTVLTILKGVDVGWNKLARTGTVYDTFSSKLNRGAVRPKKA